jgi:RsiW-degrading membrane proteinase PrsW (M82 family)
MNELIILACALLPALLLMLFIYYKDINPEPPYLVLKGFLLGMGIALPISLVEILVETLLSPFLIIPLIGAVITAFCVAAIPEETGKYLALKWLVNKYPHEMDERMDGIVYAVSVSLGFAALENVTYLFQNADAWVQVGIARALLAVPGHYAFAVLMGYFFSLYYFGDRSKATRTNIILVPVVAHGIYDTLCFVSEILPAIGGIITMMLIYFCYRMHQFALSKIREHANWDAQNQQTYDEQDSQYSQTDDEWSHGAEALRNMIENKS